MTLVRYQPWSSFDRLQRELDAFFGLAGAAAADPAAQPVSLLPRTAVREADGRYALSIDLPGVQPADIEVTAHEGILTIKAVRKAGDAVTATYQRSFRLPEDADAGTIEARSAHGVLEVTLGRFAKPEPRRITVQAA